MPAPIELLAKHVLLPGLAPASIVGLSFTPVSLVGCMNRGLLAVAVVLVSTVAACATAAIGTRRGSQARRGTSWWFISTLILVLPAVLLFGPFG